MMISLEEDFKLEFDFEEELKLEEEKSFDESAEICRFFLKGNCTKGNSCPFRHIKPDKAVVCKHWLRGLCKKGDRCEFLHEYDAKRMPECWFFAKFGECSNPECIFLHINPDDKVAVCPWYARGFCKHGPKCRYKHQFAVACPEYLTGFCIKGKTCKFVHPSFEIPKEEDYQKREVTIIKPTALPIAQQPRPPVVQYRPEEEVLCFKCREKGHYANKCPNQKYVGPDEYQRFN